MSNFETLPFGKLFLLQGRLGSYCFLIEKTIRGHGPTIAEPCLPYCEGGGAPPIKQELGLGLSIFTVSIFTDLGVETGLSASLFARSLWDLVLLKGSFLDPQYGPLPSDVWALNLYRGYKGQTGGPLLRARDHVTTPRAPLLRAGMPCGIVTSGRVIDGSTLYQYTTALHWRPHTASQLKQDPP